MQFLFPGFLWALLALLVPILIHLFYFRRFKKVYFTNVKFLKEIKEETSSRNKIKNFLILLSRLLALAFLVFAFAQPIIKSGDKVDSRANLVSVFVDNSFSMDALSEDVPLITKAKDQARAIVNAYGEQDQFQILTHELFGRQQRMISKEDALAAIDEIKPTPEVNLLQKVNNRQKQISSNENFQSINYIISDFQKNISEFQLDQDSSIQTYFIPLQSVKENNVSIDSVWLNAPVPMYNQPNELLVRLKNYGDKPAESIPMNIKYQGQSRPLGRFNIPANGATTDTITLPINTVGWQEAELNITDYPIQYDDNYKIAFNVEQEVKVLSINESSSNNYLKAVFKGISFFSIDNQTVNQLKYSNFPEYNLIIINDLRNISTGLSSTLDQYVQNGGNLLIFTNPNLNKESVNGFLSALKCNNLTELQQGDNFGASQLNRNDFIFSNVFEKGNRNIKLPSSSVRWLSTNFQNRGEQSLLKFRDGKSMLSKYQKGNGHIFMALIPLNPEKSDLVRNAEIFVPMLYKMALSKGVTQKLAYIIGKDQVIETDRTSQNNENIYKIKADKEFIPGVSQAGSRILLNMQDQIETAGFYHLSQDGEAIATYAFNHDRQESDLDYFSVDELEGKFGQQAKIINNSEKTNLGEYVTAQSQGTPLWKWCIILVLVFLALETLLIRFLKK